MNRNVISQRISDILSDTEKLKYQLRAIDTLDLRQFPKNYEIMSTEAALLSEKITCKLRSLIYASTDLRKHDYLKKAVAAHEVSVTFRDDILSISLPRLLPRRGGKYSSLFLTDTVHAALDHFNTHQPIRKYRKCAVCIVHEYDAGASDRLLFDFDNLQQKQLLDTIAVHVLTDDNALLCDVFCTAQIGESDRTTVFIMEKNRFPDWLLARRTDKKVISDFP